MTTMPERESAFEAKFAHDQELAFLDIARRDKLFVGWIAGLLQLDDAAKQSLVTTALTLPDGAAHDDLLLQLAERTLAAKGKPPARAELSAQLAHFAAEMRKPV